MMKIDVDLSLKQSWERPDCVRMLKDVVQEIEEDVVNPKTRDMLYDLMDVIIQMSERIHDLEMKVGGFNVRDSLQVQEERIRVDDKKRDSTDLYRHKRHMDQQYR